MKTDRKLLELAAKAAGIENYAWCEPLACLAQKSMDGGFYNHLNWNPLTDDGDALRLALKLGISLDIDGTNFDDPRISATACGYVLYRDYCESDLYAATRRAIVRAAAAIGESMP